MIYKHPEVGMIVTLPRHRKELPAIIVKNVIRQLVNSGIATESEVRNRFRPYI